MANKSKHIGTYELDVYRPREGHRRNWKVCTYKDPNDNYGSWEEFSSRQEVQDYLDSRNTENYKWRVDWKNEEDLPGEVVEF